MYFSCQPGNFVDKHTGEPNETIISSGYVFRGSIREWYECLSEVLIDACNEYCRETKKSPADFVVKVSDNTLMLVECSCLYRPNFDSERPKIGTYVGILSFYKNETNEDAVVGYIENNEFVPFAEIVLLDKPWNKNGSVRTLDNVKYKSLWDEISEECDNEILKLLEQT